MANVITICQRKGGCGKSTSALNLVHVLAEQGYTILLIDLDDQQNTTSSISRLVQGTYTIEDLLLKDDLGLDQVSYPTEWEKVWILPSSSNLSGVTKTLDGEVGGHQILKEKLEQPNEFDYVLIDTSPSLNILVINGLCASDFVFIPLSSKYFSLQGLKQTLNTYTKVHKRLNPSLTLLGMAFVIHDKRNVLSCEIVEKVRSQYPDVLFDSIIGINIRIEEAQVKKQSILSYAPEGRGAEQYRRLGKELIQRMERLASARGAPASKQGHIPEEAGKGGSQ